MDIENAIKRLLDSNDEVSYSQRVAIVDLLDFQQKTIVQQDQEIEDYRYRLGLRNHK